MFGNNGETVSHVAVTTTTDALQNRSTSEAGAVTLPALVAIGDTRERSDEAGPDLTVSYTLYFLTPNLPDAGAQDWFTVRGDRCEVVSGPNGRWGSMGEVVAVKKTAPLS